MDLVKSIWHRFSRLAALLLLSLTSRRTASIVLFGLVLLSFLSLALPPAPSGPSDRVPMWAGRFFWTGVNYPWKSYQDFGTGPWGHSGISDSTTYAEVDTDFANMAAQGIRIVKWRVFNDGRYSPEFDQSGYVTGLDDKFFADIDAALQIAQKHDVYLILSLFSSGFWVTDCWQNGVHIGGHADTITAPAKRRSLIQNAVIPLIQHVSHSDRVLAYEVLAEPEWGIRELNQDSDYRIKVPLDSARDFALELTRAVHLNSHALATVEANRARNLSAWRGLGLDYYSFSWYDWLEPYDPLNVPASSYSLDRPIVLGEFPVAQNPYYRLPDVLDIALRQGYAGAFAWSYLGGDKYGQLSNGSRAFRDWTRQHWSLVSLLGAAPPPENVQLQSPPYSTGKVQLGLAGNSVLVNLQVSIRQDGEYNVQVVLHPIGGGDQKFQQMPIQAGSNRLVSVTFNGLAEGKPYRLDVGVFDQNWQLKKWFQGVASLEVKGQTLQEPQLSPEASENACYSGQ